MNFIEPLGKLGIMGKTVHFHPMCELANDRWRLIDRFVIFKNCILPYFFRGRYNPVLYSWLTPLAWLVQKLEKVS
jgi:hypothetical protein